MKHGILILIASASSEGSDELAHTRSLAEPSIQMDVDEDRLKTAFMRDFCAYAICVRFSRAA